MHTVHKPMQGMGQTVTARILKTKTPWSLPHWMTLPHLIMSRQYKAKTQVTHSVIGQRQRQVTYQTETTTFTHQRQTKTGDSPDRNKDSYSPETDKDSDSPDRDKDSHSPDRDSWLTRHRHRQVTHQAQTQTGDSPGTKRWLTRQIMTGDSPGSPHRGSCLEWWG